MSCSRSLFGLALAYIFAGCASGPNVTSAAGFELGALRHAPVLIMPIATSSEMRDDRTGIVLRNESLVDSYKTMCEQARHELTDIKVQCAYDAAAMNARASMRELMQDFAHDRPTQPATLTALAANLSVSYALLFRPESVSASRREPKPEQHQEECFETVTKRCIRKRPSFAEKLGTGVANGLATMVVRSLGVPGPSVVTSRVYTVSAMLLDLQHGKVARYGAHSAKGTTHGEGYPEPAPILAKAMLELADAIIDD